MLGYWAKADAGGGAGSTETRRASCLAHAPTSISTFLHALQNAVATELELDLNSLLPADTSYVT